MAVIDSDALKRRLKRFADSLPSGAEMTVTALVDVMNAIIDAEARKGEKGHD